MSGSVANVAETQFAEINLGNTSSSVSDGASFTLTRVPDGPVDLVATRGTTTSGSAALDKMIIRRGLNPANNSTLPVLDFSCRSVHASGGRQCLRRQSRIGSGIRDVVLPNERRGKRRSVHDS